MKKNIKILLLLLLPLLLCSCKSKFQLIEINSEELVNSLYGEDVTGVIAFYYPENNNSKPFMEDLKYYVKNNRINIYYINMQYIDFKAESAIYFLFENPIQYNSYIILEDSEIKLQNNYHNSSEFREDIMKSPRNSTIKLISEEKKKEHYEKAIEELNNGYISSSYYYLLRSTPLKEAKDAIDKKNSIYSIIGTWKSHIKKDKNYILNIDVMNNQYVDETFTDKEIEEINFKNDYKYYKIINNIFYTSATEEGEYKEKFEIIKIEENKLIIKDLKTNKKMEMEKKG